jgi:hypothetical protein
MVGREDIGRVNDCGIVRPGHIRRNSATQVAGEKLVFTTHHPQPNKKKPKSD